MLDGTLYLFPPVHVCVELLDRRHRQIWRYCLHARHVVDQRYLGFVQDLVLNVRFLEAAQLRVLF